MNVLSKYLNLFLVISMAQINISYCQYTNYMLLMLIKKNYMLLMVGKLQQLFLSPVMQWLTRAKSSIELTNPIKFVFFFFFFYQLSNLS